MFQVFSLVFTLALIVGLIVLVVAAARRRGPGIDARSVRRFFQYVLLFALVMVVAIGVAELLGMLLGADVPEWVDPDAELARGLAFVFVGGPLLAVLAWATRRSHRLDPAERDSGLYIAYVTLAALVAAFVAATALPQVGFAALGDGDLDADGVAVVLTWTAVWAVHWWLARRTLDGDRNTPHLLLGSVLGLVMGVAGLVNTLGGSLDLLLGLERYGRPLGVLGESLGAVLAGGLLWVRYWATAAIRLPRRPLWLAVVLPLGVGGGLIMALVGGSRLLWSVLVWFVGDRQGSSATQHFDSAAVEAAAVVVGLVVWWYHRTVLGTAEGRTEPRRVYEYLVAGIGLAAAAVGVGTVLVSLIEALTPGVDVGMTVMNTLLAAVTLLVVGVPVWWIFWSRVRRAAAVSPDSELVSPTRRVYLVVLFGLAGIAAVVALIAVAVIVLQDVVAGSVSGVTLRSSRYGLGTLVGAAAVSAYHGAVFRQDRAAGATVRVTGPRSVVLVGAVGPELDRELTRATSSRVEVWGRLDAAAAPWDLAGLAATLGEYPGADVVVVADGGGYRVIPVDLSGRRAFVAPAVAEPAVDEPDTRSGEVR
ncbi:hypothetical protein BCR15_05650 [Tessaracoccus lapidicaptus]|uniref:DUF5671 domain-containing protein n=1 Tax=Tessaracoccus lapidicaptus TaxID=1427523 RepID=A0A1C0AKV5_9ACTN|nr:MULTISPECIES: DUF5671 domain-containing protein [Tessaracoccus]AQX16010.1 hypothetical protein BKM78_08840 [Tessaracoccus sp. T2.5-30]OCL33311.1 hypothetical protein BCR15_05650 [Tessaracoccus lapidicaptus]VEP40518.1 hypothetical protein TLA_TLA_01783 [Tessaracoccus lapidicaptus]